VVLIKNFNVVRLDSKGRIIVPFHIRDYLGLKEGTELIVTNNEKKELRIFPLMNGDSAILRTIMSDAPGSLSRVLGVVARNKVDILMSMSRTIEKGRLAEWSAIVDISLCKDVKKFENDMKSMKIIKKLEVEKK